MQTPTGRTCPYYYVDAHRKGTADEACRLLDTSTRAEASTDAGRWNSKLCVTCPVPQIRWANRCPTMTLHARVRRPRLLFWLSPRMEIRATCSRSGGQVADPMIGCGQCHENLEFVVAEPTGQEQKKEKDHE